MSKRDKAPVLTKTAVRDAGETHTEAADQIMVFTEEENRGTLRHLCRYWRVDQ